MAAEVTDEINGIRSGAAVTIEADVSTVESCKRLLDEALKTFGKIDILVLNAGITGLGVCVKSVRSSSMTVSVSTSRGHSSWSRLQNPT